jgi:ATP-binding cassette, subfamily B, bacterial
MSSHEIWRMVRYDDVDRNKKLPKGLFRRVFKFARPYRRLIIGLMGTLVVLSALGVITPLIIKRIIDEALPTHNTGLLARLSLAILVVALASGAVGVVMRYLTSYVGEGLIFDLRVALFDHVQRMPIAFFTRTQTGALISRLSNDVVGAQRAVTETTSGVIQVVADLVFTIVVMFRLEWRLTLVALVVVPLFIIPTKKMGNILGRMYRRQMESNAKLNNQMTERFQVGGALLVKLFGDYRAEQGHFSEKAKSVRDMGIKTALYGRLFYVSFAVVAAAGTALAYWLGGRMVIGGTLKIGTIVAFSLYLTKLYGPITGLSSMPADVKTAMVSFDRVFEVLDFPSAITEKPDAVELPAAEGRVEFDQVWFRYPSGSDVTLASLEEGRVETAEARNQWVLKGVSFTVEPGQTVALVGPSGAGKTTISGLVPRLFDVSQGSVSIDRVDVRDLKLDSLSAAVGTVPQDAHMFHDTIRANLSYAKPDATEQELVDAAKSAHIWELIETLPDGLDTMVGERGYRLSGGEKQRLAIARLLLKDPAVVILDEATAHLDSESEVLIQQALAEVLAGRSSLVIAHRLSTIVNADMILVIDGGRVVERGTHHELMRGGGLYQDLYLTQFQSQEEQLEPVKAVGRDSV